MGSDTTTAGAVWCSTLMMHTGIWTQIYRNLKLVNTSLQGKTKRKKERKKDLLMVRVFSPVYQ